MEQQQKNAINMSPKNSRTEETEKRVGTAAGGGERLKRHRMEVAGRVWIPETWGQEESLKDWIDCTTFDAALANSRIMSARAALINDARLRSSSNAAVGLRITNTC
ncbi:protein BIC1-like [Impatiens glandulifera]|uniref:protein BIC1-like n=1 Tax=Impatiens glandulifera TaxID=253017 RepID=UPI001FB13638|nr:protein BIC1-like [Impatiens glandulifera]